jgi:hypothetical protein
MIDSELRVLGRRAGIELFNPLLTSVSYRNQVAKDAIGVFGFLYELQ